MNQAKAIDLRSGSFSTTQQIHTSDRADTFRLRWSSRSRLNLQLQSLQSPVQATIAFDRNRNGRLDRSETIAQTGATRSNTALSQSMRSGTYWLRVSATEQGDARYRLTLTTEPSGVGAIARRSNHFISKVLQLTNTFRRQNGMRALRLNDRLTTAAQRHSQDMALQDFFAHEGRNGSTVQARGVAAGYPGRTGENIAAGQPTPHAVVQAWINSEPHRKNLLDPRYRDIGIGFFDNPNDSGTTNYRYYWTQNFGIPTA